MSSQPVDPSSTSGGCGLPGELAALHGRVGELSRTLLAARGPVELMDTVGAIETLKTSLDAFELAVVRELDATGAVKPVGWASTQDFVTAVSGGTKATGPAVVRLAKAVDEPVLAPVGEAMRAGWLSTVKAHVINRAADELPGDPDLRGRAVQFLLGEARGLDATELRKLTTRLLSIVDPTGGDRREEKELDREERSAHLNRNLSIKDDGAGGAWIRGRCSSEDAAQIKTTLMPLARPHPSAGPVCDPGTCAVPGCGHDGRDPRDHGARMLDALVELCRQAKTVDLLPDCHGATPRVTITMDFEDLKKQSGFGTTETGEDLSASAVRRLCCDADLIPTVLGSRSEVLDVGRLQRLVTAAIWKALVARDKHCRFPNCTRPPMLCHAHHLIHWIDGGETSLPNMILLCGHHHRLIHAAPWTIEKTGPAEFEFHPPPGVRRAAPTPRPPPIE